MENLVLGGGRGIELNEKKARKLLEKVRWPEGPICPHCVMVGGHYRVRPQKGSKSAVRDGVWKCRDCRKQFTVTVGTVFQGSKIPLSKWVTAIYLMGDSAKRLNPHQLHQRLKLTYKSARLMSERIAESMKQGALPRKLNSLLRAQGSRIMVKRAKKRVKGAKKPAKGVRGEVSPKRTVPPEGRRRQKKAKGKVSKRKR